mgnify:CR=1 FL=1
MHDESQPHEILPAEGVLADLDETIRQRLAAAGVPVSDYGSVDTLIGAGDAIAVQSPAGLRIEIHQRPD